MRCGHRAGQGRSPSAIMGASEPQGRLPDRVRACRYRAERTAVGSAGPNVGLVLGGAQGIGPCVSLAENRSAP